MNVTGLTDDKSALVQVILGNGFVPPGNKPFPESMLIQCFEAMWRHWATTTQMKIRGRRHWYYHIIRKYNSASRQINTSQELSKFLSENRKLLIHQSFVSANFNIPLVVWSPCMTNVLSMIMQRIYFPEIEVWNVSTIIYLQIS